jgi:predicted MFS family arabinose efflux permease
MSAFSAMVVAVMLLRTPDEVRGRVMATVNGTLRGFGVIALVLGGLMVQFLGARAAFAVVGILVIGAAVLIRRVMRWVPPEAATISESRPASRPA